MPKLTVEGFGTVEVRTESVSSSRSSRMRSVDILHACGGNARCTTCRVEFIDGEPARMTAAERQVLAAKALTGVRLSCQILCDHDMTVRAISRLTGSGRPDPGPQPASEITPPPEWNLKPHPRGTRRLELGPKRAPEDSSHSARGSSESGTPETRARNRSAGAKPQSRRAAESSTSAGQESTIPWRF